MSLRSLLMIQCFATLTLVSAARSQNATSAGTENPVEVMVVGMYHMSNPGHDLHDAKSDDVLQLK